MPVNGILRITDTLQYIPKAFAFPKKKTQKIIYSNQLDTPKYNSFLVLWWWKKVWSIILPTSCKEGHLSQANKFYHYHQCYHKLKVKIFNFKISPPYQYQLRRWNWFLNLRRCKCISPHPHNLQEISWQHPPGWIHIQIHGLINLQNIWRHPILPKPRKHKWRPGKFNTAYAVPRAILEKFTHPSSI